MDVCAASLRALRPVRLLLWEAASTHAARATTALSASAVPSRRRLATRAEEEEATRERRLREMGAHGATAARAAAHAQASSSSHPSVTSLEDMLVDGHGRRHTYLRISLTERCNLRCQYCMPYEGNKLTDKPRLLRVDELRRLATLFVRAGVNKIRLTGGEPTIRRDIVDIARMLKHDVGVRELAITTNGVLMGSGGGIHEGSQGSDGRMKGMALLSGLVDAGVSSLNVSLDSLQPQRFSVLSRSSARGLDRVLHGIDMAAGFMKGAAGRGMDESRRSGGLIERLKVNVVVMRGINDDEVGDFVERFALGKGDVNVRFIEYMPFDQNGWNFSKMVPQKEVMQRVTDVLARSGHELRRVDLGRTAVGSDYDVVATAGGAAAPPVAGRVSFVSSMTDKFCSGCNRLRLLADGSLKVCLFSNERDETSLRDLLRAGASDEEIAGAVKAALMQKKAAHAGMFELHSNLQNRSMTSIGG